MTHDYKRNGTTSLFAALEVLQGRVIGQCYERHRHQEFLLFLRRLDQEFPGEIRLHLVMDNYGTHKQPKVQAWLKHHPRFVAHFVPTSSSWLNLVERWFGELTSKRIRAAPSAAWQTSRSTLGGLVELGNPASLGRHLRQALENMHVCASDPLCSEHAPSSDGRGIHGSCCHACLFAPETSCERGNRYLDRSVLVGTFDSGNTAFFE